MAYMDGEVSARWKVSETSGILSVLFWHLLVVKSSPQLGDQHDFSLFASVGKQEPHNQVCSCDW